MITRSTNVFLFVATLLVSAATFLVFKLDAQPVRFRMRQPICQDASRCTGFRCEIWSESFSCERSNDVWRVTAPRSAPADKETVKRFLAAVETTPVLERLSRSDLEKRETSQEKLGLLHPTATVVFSRPGEKPLEIRIGTGPEGSSRHYLTLNGGTDVYAVPPSFLQAVPLSPVSLYDRTLIPGNPENLREFTVVSGGRVLLDLRNTGTGWNLVKPVPCAADPAAVKNFLDYFADVRIHGFVPENAEDFTKVLEDHGCSPENASAVLRLDFLTVGGLERDSAELRFGGRVPDSNPPRVYLYRPGTPLLAEIESAVLPAATNSVVIDALRDRRVFPGVRPEALSSFSVFFPGDSSPLVFTGSPSNTPSWSLSSPEPVPALTVAAEFVSALCGLTSTAAEVAPDTPVSPEEATVVLSLASGPVTARVSEASTVWTISGADSVAHTVSSPPSVTRERLLDLLDPEILSLPEGTSVGSASLQRGDAPPVALSGADLSAVSTLLSPLVSLRTESVAALSLEPYGLLPPSESLVFTAADRTRTLLLGLPTREGDGRYALLKGSNRVFVLPSDFLKSVPAGATK